MNGPRELGAEYTSNDCAYQSWTFLIEGISFSPSGKSPSSCTRWARRMGSSSDKNWDARKSVPAQRIGQSSASKTDSGKGTKGTCWRSFAKLDHLAKADSRGREGGVMLDGLHQHLRCLPRHAERPRPYGLWSNVYPRSCSSRVHATKQGGEEFQNNVFAHRLFVAEDFSGWR